MTDMRRNNERLEQMLGETQSWFGGRPTPAGVDLEPGETLYFVALSIELLELTKTARPLMGGSSDFSYAAAAAMAQPGTELVRRVWVDEPVTAKDVGSLVITDRRVLFTGANRRREWSFNELEDLAHDERVPESWLMVASRKRISGFRYAAAGAVDLRFYLALALATERDERRALYSALLEQLPPATAVPEATIPVATGGTAVRVLKRIYTGRPGAAVGVRALQGGLAAIVTLTLLAAVLPDQSKTSAELSATSTTASGESDAARRDGEAGEAAAKKAADDKAAADRAAAEQAAADQAAADKAAADKAAADKAAADKAAAEAAARAAAARAAAAKAAAAKAAAAKAAAAKAAAQQAAAQQAAAQPQTLVGSGSGCTDAYPDFCIPARAGDAYNCPDFSQKDFTAKPSDPYGLDRDHDGIACES